MKLNVDATFDEDGRSGATGAILRDDRGNFIAAQGVYVERGADITSMEARAMMDDLILANSLGFHNIEAHRM